MMKERIQQLAKKYAPEFIEVRHQIHSNPELSYQEFETSAFVQKKLAEFGIPFEVKATTGVVGLIKGKIRIKKLLLCVPIWMHYQSQRKMMFPTNRKTMV